MIKYILKKITAFILLLIIFILAGCWDSREINELGLVMAVGIDKAPDSDNYILTVQIANEKLSTQSGAAGQPTEPVYVVAAEGKTLFDATRELSKVSSKRIMWAHNYIVIIGESVARDSILPVIDYFTHNPELRMKTAVVVAKGDAMPYLGIKSGMEEVPGITFSDIHSFASLTAEYIQTDLLSLSQSYYSGYSEPIISTIGFKKSKLILGEKPSSDLVEEVQFNGSAVFKRDKMVGLLTDEETEGLSWIFGNTIQTVVSVTEPSDSSKFVSVEINNASPSITSVIENGTPSIIVTINGTGHIVEEDANKKLSINEYKDAVERLVCEKIVYNIGSSLDKTLREYKSDVVGFAKYIHAQHNKEWESFIKQNWENIYPQMTITINARIALLSSTTYQLPEQN